MITEKFRREFYAANFAGMLAGDETVTKIEHADNDAAQKRRIVNLARIALLSTDLAIDVYEERV